MANNVSPTLVILAAGMGSRYGGLKQIEPVGTAGEAVLDYSIFDAWRAGFSAVVFVIRRQLEQEFRATVGRRFEARGEVRYVFQELDSLPAGFKAPPGREKPWGTGHAVLCAAGRVREPFAAINADDFYGAESFRIIHRFLAGASMEAKPPLYCMVGYTLRTTLSDHGTVARGLCQADAEGYLTSVEELTAIGRAGAGALNHEPNGNLRRLSGDEIVSLNFWGFTPGIFPQLEQRFRAFLELNAGNPRAEFYLPVAIGELLARDEARVRVLPTPDSWSGVTYREDRKAVVEKIQSLVHAGVYPEKLWI